MSLLVKKSVVMEPDSQKSVTMVIQTITMDVMIIARSNLDGSATAEVL